MALKEIFESITPDNIKDISLLRDAMNIFIEMLEETSGVSIDIKNIFNDQLYLSNLKIYENIIESYNLEINALQEEIDSKYNELNAYSEYIQLTQIEKDQYNLLYSEYIALKNQQYEIQNNETYIKYNNLVDLYKSANNNLKNSVSETYVNNLYKIIVNAQNSEELKTVLSGFPDNVPLKQDVNKILNDEYFYSNKKFKQTLGTKKSIEYAYGFAKYLERNDTTPDDFYIDEKIPFYFHIKGQIYRETYENIVKPMSHPIGFSYHYIRDENSLLTDFYEITNTAFLTDDFSFNVLALQNYLISDDDFYFTFDTPGADTSGFYLVESA